MGFRAPPTPTTKCHLVLYNPSMPLFDIRPVTENKLIPTVPFSIIFNNLWNIEGRDFGHFENWNIDANLDLNDRSRSPEQRIYL